MINLNRSNISWQEFEDKLYILTSHDNALHELNATGARVFKMLWEKQGITLSELTDAIVKEYNVTPREAADDLSVFIADLRQKQIINSDD